MSAIPHAAGSVPAIPLLAPESFKISSLIILLILFLIGCWFSPLAIGGCLGFVFGYYQFQKRKQKSPQLWPLSKRMKRWVVTGGVLVSIASFWSPLPPAFTYDPDPPIYIDAYAQTVTYQESVSSPWWLWLSHSMISSLVLALFIGWQKRVKAGVREFTRHGSARFATPDELRPYLLNQKIKAENKVALYIGGGKYFYPKQGHALTIAGTRAGKGVNLLVPNLLGAAKGNASWVVIDPKGELAAITANHQKKLGKTVRILNPWGVLGLPNDTFNPLDLIFDHNSKHLADDAQMLATMIVPSVPGKDSHWDKKARTLIAGVLMHFATTFPEDEPSFQLSLGNLWKILNSSQDDWLNFLAEMALNEHPISGDIIEGAANSILNLMATSSKEAASVLSTAQTWVDIFKSTFLRESVHTSSFNINELSQGNTIVYVIIPADKLKSHYTWLRLVIATAMKAVVRNPKERVIFALDECYALGYLEELEVALGTYAGYNISIWSIFQSLGQLKDLYRSWENFFGNSAVIQAFGLNDNTTADYISKMAGKMSVPTYKNKILQGLPDGSTGRELISPDEARRLDDSILLFIDNNPPALVPKVPYYNHKIWSKRADKNPYFRG